MLNRYAVWFDGGTTHSALDNATVFDTGGGGIRLGGYPWRGHSSANHTFAPLSENGAKIVIGDVFCTPSPYVPAPYVPAPYVPAPYVPAPYVPALGANNVLSYRALRSRRWVQNTSRRIYSKRFQPHSFFSWLGFQVVILPTSRAMRACPRYAKMHHAFGTHY